MPARDLQDLLRERVTVGAGNDVLDCSSAQSPIPHVALRPVVQGVGVGLSVGLDHREVALRHSKVCLEDTEQGGHTLAGAGASQDDLHAWSEDVLIEREEYDGLTVPPPAVDHVLDGPGQMVPAVLTSSSGYLNNNRVDILLARRYLDTRQPDRHLHLSRECLR